MDKKGSCQLEVDVTNDNIQNANKIIVLNEGEIIQKGTHSELVNPEGYYKELYSKQLLEKEM